SIILLFARRRDTNHHPQQPMAREINLDGSEVTIIKALGLGSAEMSGETMIEKVPDMMPVELADVLKGLITMGYVNADKTSFYSDDEFKKTHFQVNPGYSRELREALN